MPIRPFLKNGVFEPHVVTAMSRAFVEACAILNISDADHDAREGVASIIIALAQRGEHDPSRLLEAVVSPRNSS